MIIELRMESQNFYLGLIILAAFLFVIWFLVGRKGGYGQPTVLNLKNEPRQENAPPEKNPYSQPIVQADSHKFTGESQVRDVTPPMEKLSTPPIPPGPPPQCLFVYNGHDWDAFEVLGVSPYAGFSEITKAYQQQIKRIDPGKHEFLQTAYMAILKRF